MGITARAFASLRTVGVLVVLAAVAGAGLAYGLFVVEQYRYFTGRNFRLLNTLAGQLDNTADAEARVLGALAQNVGTDTRAAKDSLKATWMKVRQGRYASADLELAEGISAVQNPTAQYEFIARPIRLKVHVKGEGEPRQELATLKVQRMLDPIFMPKVGEGVFDTIVLAARDGSVLYAAGLRAKDVESSGLAALLPVPTKDGIPVDSAKIPNPFTEVARKTALTDVTVAGVDYKLFVQPCCAPTTSGDPLVIAGLVESDALRSRSWAISTTVVKLAVLAMLIALVSWPFLRLGLIGDRQSVGTGDLLQLGVSSVTGLAIVTMALFDAAAYWQLNRDTDSHLELLARSLDAKATEEVSAAYSQLSCLAVPILQRRAELALRKEKPPEAETHDTVLAKGDWKCGNSDRPAGAVAASLNTGSNDPAALVPGAWPYPFFEALALIDAQGMQRIKLATAGWVPSRVNVGERVYFKDAFGGRGWQHPTMCPEGSCVLESVWAWTSGEPLAVLATHLPNPEFPVAAISIPMRSLIRPVLPPGFEFAVIDRSGRVLFHSDRQRNLNENFFEETDDNRRLRAQVAAHSAEPVNIRYWGAAYRAYVKPMELPGAYVVVMAQKQRAWAINREWLVVALIFLSAYMVVWLVTALICLRKDSSWIWPDPARRAQYHHVTALCVLLLGVTALAVWKNDWRDLVLWAVVIPIVAVLGTRLILIRRPAAQLTLAREPVADYSAAACLLLVVSAVVPGALLFLASYNLHAQSYVKNSQLLMARALSERSERLAEEYADARGPGKAVARSRIDQVRDIDLYLGFLYATCIRSHDKSRKMHDDRCGAAPPYVDEASAAQQREDGDEDVVLSLLEDYLPYYSEASVEWRELLHDRADDNTWSSRQWPDGRLTMTVGRPDGPHVSLTSTPPQLYGAGRVQPAVPQQLEARGTAPRQVDASTGQLAADPSGGRWRLSMGLVMAICFPLVLAGLTWGVVYIFLRHIFLVGVTEPLWTTAKLAVSAGDSVFVVCDPKTKEAQLAGTVPLALKPIAASDDVQAAWRTALIALDRRNQAGGAVLVVDFDDDLENTALMDVKLTLLEELVNDPSRTVVLLSELSPTGLSDGFRRANRPAEPRHRGSRNTGGSHEAAESAIARWKRLLASFVVLDWRGVEVEPAEGAPAVAIVGAPPADAARPVPAEPPARGEANSRWRDYTLRWRTAPLRELLDREGRSHKVVSRVCADLRQTEAVQKGTLTRAQLFDEIAERTAHFYRSVWASCSEDEKVVLSHVARHGLANASVRTVVRRLLGRRLLLKDPALRPMSETFRKFVLSKECVRQVTVLENVEGPSAWDRLRVPMALGVVGTGIFLFATQKELYNAILGVTTAAAVSVPTLVRAVGMLAGRRPSEGDAPRA